MENKPKRYLVEVQRTIEETYVVMAACADDVEYEVQNMIGVCSPIRSEETFEVVDMMEKP